jgi:hypothetical protein
LPPSPSALQPRGRATSCAGLFLGQLGGDSATISSLKADALAAIYRYGSSRTEARWQWLSVGSAAAAIGWLITSALFSWYIAHFGAYNATYRSLGAAIGMMMWMWISAIVVLLGGELNPEIEHQTARDSTVGSEKPLGWRGGGDGRHNWGGEGRNRFFSRPACWFVDRPVQNKCATPLRSQPTLATTTNGHEG